MKIVKVCYSEGSLGRNIGCSKGPDAIVGQLRDVWMSEDFGSVSYEVVDSGVRNGDSRENIYEKILKCDGDLYLGGDHSISYYLFKKFAAEDRDAGLVVFDAHPDCYKRFDFPTHEDWILHLIEEGVLKPERVLFVGVRAGSLEELEFFKKHKIRCYYMKDVFGNVEEVCDSVMEIVRGFGNLYLSLDVDVVEPAFAPGTGYLEPGGLSGREMIYFLQRLKLLKNLKRVDIVEVNPEIDVNGMTCKLAARLVGELIC